MKRSVSVFVLFNLMNKGARVLFLLHLTTLTFPFIALNEKNKNTNIRSTSVPLSFHSLPIQLKTTDWR